jgi:NSS family neurotransmitter:Na+ symporter
MPMGYLFGVGFFILVIIAALTSTVSMLEVPVAYFVDEKRWTRRNAVLFVALVSFLIGTPAAQAHGASAFWSNLPLLGTDFFTLISTVFGDISLSIGAFFIAVFAGWVWGTRKAVGEITLEGNTFRLAGLWSFLIRYVAPVTIAIIFVNVIWTIIRG